MPVLDWKMNRYFIQGDNKMSKKKIKLPRLRKAKGYYISGDSQEWTYQYWPEDYEELIHLKDNRHTTEADPNYRQIYTFGMCTEFLNYPEVLVGSKSFPNQSVDEIRKRLEHQILSIDSSEALMRDIRCEWNKILQAIN